MNQIFVKNRARSSRVLLPLQVKIDKQQAQSAHHSPKSSMFCKKQLAPLKIMEFRKSLFVAQRQPQAKEAEQKQPHRFLRRKSDPDLQTPQEVSSKFYQDETGSIISHGQYRLASKAERRTCERSTSKVQQITYEAHTSKQNTGILVSIACSQDKKKKETNREVYMQMKLEQQLKAEQAELLSNHEQQIPDIVPRSQSWAPNKDLINKNIMASFQKWNPSQVIAQYVEKNKSNISTCNVSTLSPKSSSTRSRPELQRSPKSFRVNPYASHQLYFPSKFSKK